MKSYYGMTVHYITDWCLQSVMLACSRFRGSHTGDAISEEYEKIMASFQISNKVSFIISDSASNMIKAFSLPGFEEEYDDNLEDESDDDSEEEGRENVETLEELEDFYSELNQHVSCFAHVLQLVIKDGFKQATSINKVLNKASSIVSHVRKSIVSSEILESEKRLKAANVTRWNSQLKMIRSILRIPEEKLQSLDTHKLTAYDRKILKDVVEILTPFETATHCIQGDKVVTCSMVVPCVRVLKSTIDSLSHKYTSRFVATLKASINDRLSKYENIDAFLMASALDPRFKLKWCKPIEYNELQAKLILKLNQQLRNEQDSQITETSDSTSTATLIVDEATPEISEQVEEESEPPAKKMKTFFSSLISEPVTTTNTENVSQNINTMVDEYLLSPCLRQEEDPLVFWKINQTKFAPLAKMARRFLCIPASSAPVERFFSIAGKVFRPDRCRLTDKRFEELMFIRCNQLS